MIDSLMFISFIIVSLASWILTSLVRAVCENIIKSLKKSNLWRDVAMPFLPALVGAFLGFIMQDVSVPDGFDGTVARIILGLVAGFFSGTMYRVVKKSLLDKVSLKK